MENAHPMVTERMLQPANTLEEILLTQARGLERYFGILLPSILPLKEKVQEVDLAVFFNERLREATVALGRLICWESPDPLQRKQGQDMAETWVSECVAPDLYNTIGLVLWVMGSDGPPTIEAAVAAAKRGDVAAIPRARRFLQVAR